MTRTFFSLPPEYSEKITYESIFALKHLGGLSISEIYNLPIGLRNWYLNRIERYLKEMKEKTDNKT